MTLLIGKLCTDGVILIADSVSRRSDGSVSNNGIKSHRSEFNGEPFGVVFGGSAGVDGAKSTLDFIKGVSALDGNLQVAMEKALRAACHEINAHPFTEEDLKKMPAEMEDDFVGEPMVSAFFSVRHFEWYSVSVTEITKVPPYHQNTTAMRGHLPTRDEAIKAELEGLYDHNYQKVSDAAKTCAVVFQRTMELLPNVCRYPGTVLLHRQNGVTESKFNTPEELIAVCNAPAV